MTPTIFPLAQAIALQEIIDLDRLWTLGSAILILLVGWAVAMLVASTVKTLLKQTDIDNKIAAWLVGQQEGEELPKVEEPLARLAFWLIFLLAVLAFLDTLNLDTVSQPLNALLERVTEFLPQLGAAIILLGVAWLLATALKVLAVQVLRTLDLDRRLGEQLGTPPDGERVAVGEAIANTLYWFIFLLFLPSILSTLQLEGTLDPVQSMLDRILAILPNVFAAGLIGVIGWFVAQIVRRIVTNLLAATRLDTLGDRLGLEATEERQPLSGIIGTIAFVLVLIPVAIAALERLQIAAISDPAIEMLNQMLGILPKLFAAVAIAIWAYFGGRLLAEFIAGILASIGFNNLFSWLGFPASATPAESTPAEGETPQVRMQTPSELVGTIVRVGIMLIAVQTAVDILQIEALTELMVGIIFISGRILAGLIVLAIGLWLSNLAFTLILNSGVRQARTLAQATRIVVIAFVVAMSLQQMGIATSIVNLAFGLLLGAIAVALAISFGVGGREVAGELLRDWVNAFRSGGDRS